MKKTISILALFSLLFFGVQSLIAQNVSRELAATVAKNFIRTQKEPEKGQHAPRKIDPVIICEKASDGQPACYIVALPNQGWVIVAGDKRVQPVMAFSDQPVANPYDMNPAARMWLETLKKEIELVRAQQTESVNPQISSDWLELSGHSEPQITGSAVTVGPLLATNWGQGGYYNQQCPYASSSCQNAAAGCVAIAMAQIMRYYAYPFQPSNICSYTDPKANVTCGVGGTRTNNFGSFTYDWSAIPDTGLTFVNFEAAKVIYHAGLSVEMDYEVVSSGAYITMVPVAFKKYFNYPQTVIKSKSDYPSNTAWFDLIDAEIDANRLVLFSGDFSTGGGGHAWVCDGYKYSASNTHAFHMNWGWYGNYDGWFTQANSYSVNGHLYNGLDAIIGFNPPKPSVPTGVAASDDAYTDKVRITWTQQSNWYYKVYRSTKADGSDRVAITSWRDKGSWDDTGANPGVTYYYHVRRATNRKGTWYSELSTPNTGRRAAPIAGDEPCTAIALSAGATASYTSANNTNATLTAAIPLQYCASGGATGAKDLWFSATIPASGVMTIRTLAESLTDGVMYLYKSPSNSCQDLQYIGCEDDNNDGAGQFMPVMSVTGTAGSKVFIRFWGYTGGVGSFQICALNYITQNMGSDNPPMVDLEQGQTFENRYEEEKLLKPSVKQNKLLSVSPNPAVDFARVMFLSQEDVEAELTIINNFGQVVRRTSVQLEEGDNKIDLPELFDFPSGTYYVKIQSDGESHTVRLNIIHSN